MALDTLVDNNDNSNKYIVMYDKQVQLHQITHKSH